MKRINRRDYLISMGVGAGAIIGAAGLDGVAVEQKSDNQLPIPRRTTITRTQRSSRPLELTPWLQRSSDPPPMETRPNIVRLIFYGLMGLSYRLDKDKRSIATWVFMPAGTVPIIIACRSMLIKKPTAKRC